ncbi:MAG: hypothetical protein KAR11_08015 [Phycisphaerae bacterium]|nr:hypothetical protein [Phycisphaerae bacterium]
MREVRMENTEGLGKQADVWVDGTLLTVCDGISTTEDRCPAGLVEGVRFRYNTDECVSWEQAIADNPSRRVSLEPLKKWSYAGFGRVEQVLPVVIHFGVLRMEDPNWSTDEDLIGKFVRVGIDRLEIVRADADDEDFGDFSAK